MTSTHVERFDLRVLVDSVLREHWMSEPGVSSVTLDYSLVLPSLVCGSEKQVAISLAQALQSAVALVDEALVRVELGSGPENGKLCLSVEQLRGRRQMARDVSSRVRRWVVGDFEFDASDVPLSGSAHGSHPPARGRFVVASPHWPTRYYIARDLRALGATVCHVISLEGLRNIARDGVDPPCCAIVDHTLWGESLESIVRLREAVGILPLVSLSRSSARVSSGDLLGPSGFDLQLDAPVGARSLRSMLHELRELNLVEVNAA